MTRSNAHTVLTVVIRAFAAYGGVATILALSNVGMNPDLVSWPFVWWLLGASLIVFAFLWLFADKFAKLSLVRNTGEVFDSDIDAKALHAIGLSLVGVVFVVDGLVSLVYAGRSYMVMQKIVANDPTRELPDLGGDLMVSIAGVALGAALVLGARGLANLLQRVRYGGMRANEVEPRDAP